MSNESPVQLAVLIGELRRELIRAQQFGAAEVIQFQVEEVELEVEVTASKKVGGEVGLEFWVVKSKADAEKSADKTQKLRLKLKPHTNSKRDPSKKDVFINQDDADKPED